MKFLKDQAKKTEQPAAQTRKIEAIKVKTDARAGECSHCDYYQDLLLRSACYFNCWFGKN